MEDKIVLSAMIQIAGKPEENVTKALEFVEKQLKENKNFKVLESDIAKPELDEETTLYTGFIETEIRFRSMQEVLGFMVDYTPASVDIIEPHNLSFNSAEMTGILNDMSQTILQLQSKVRNLSAHIHLMQKKEKKD